MRSNNDNNEFDYDYYQTNKKPKKSNQYPQKSNQYSEKPKFGLKQ